MAQTMASSTNATPLRLACDNCSAAKVRCDKKRPACDRCINTQVPCTYSASRRHGKQSWQKKLACERQKAMAAATATAAAAPMPSRTPSITPANLTMNTTPPLALFPQGWTPTNTTFSSGNGGDPILTPTTFQAHQGSHDLIDPMQDWLNDDFTVQLGLGDLDPSTLQLDHHLTYISNRSSASTSTSTTTRSSRITTEPSEPSPISPPVPQGIEQGPGDQTSLCLNLMGSNVSVRDTLERAPSQTSDSTTHDCEARALTVLGLLNHCPTSRMETAGGAKTQKGEMNLVPSFDRLLHTNKTALDSWSDIMKCSCAQCPHLTFLYISILSKLLFWYRVAADANRPVSEAAPREKTGSPLSSPSSQQSRPPRVNEFGVRPTQVQLGMFDLDPDDQANLRRVILLRELRKVEKVINEMGSIQRNVDDDADDATHNAVKWSSLGISHIREELQKMIQNIKDTR